MSRKLVPSEKPRLSSSELRAMLVPYAIDRTKYPIVVVGIRAYYRNSMGAPGVNDRGIYDDAIFIDTVQATAAWSGRMPAVRRVTGSPRFELRCVTSRLPTHRI